MERIAAFKAAANATQPPYGTIHHAAVVLTLEKAEIVPPKRMYDVSKNSRDAPLGEGNGPNRSNVENCVIKHKQLALTTYGKQQLANATHLQSCVVNAFDVACVLARVAMLFRRERTELQ
eukprot:gene19535-26215_t